MSLVGCMVVLQMFHCTPLLCVYILCFHSLICLQATNGGLVMVTFYNYFVKCGPKATVADVAGTCGLLLLLLLLLLLYRVIHKSLRDFRTRLRNNQDRHGRNEHINRQRISRSFFFVLEALAYFQVPPLGGSRDEKWRSQ